MDILCPVSLGELVDKISILRIKSKFIKDKEKLKHVRLELTKLETTLAGLNLKGIDSHLDGLEKVNGQLWKIEDGIREKEREKSFDQKFIELARAVYHTNDERFRKKDQINREFGSIIVETKSYKDY